jgi:hypothetical protein
MLLQCFLAAHIKQVYPSTRVAFQKVSADIWANYSR